MNVPHSDALVFFGATGDLTYKKICPALYAMEQRRHLQMPVIGVARSDWTIEKFRARARASVEQHGGFGEEAAWEIVQPVLGSVVPVHDYEPGTWGPAEAEKLIGASR